MATDSDIAAMEARAQALRTKFNDQLDQGRRAVSKVVDESNRQAEAARGRATEADRQVKSFTEHRDATRKEQREAELAAVEADGKGLSLDAQEHRERAAGLAKLATEADGRIAPAKSEGDAARAEATQALARRDAAIKARDEQNEALGVAEGQIDSLENKARYHREANEHEANATKLQGEADELRQAGKTEDADQKTKAAVDESIAANAKRGSADELQVDDSKLDVIDKPLVVPGATGAQAGLQDSAFSDASGIADAGTGGVSALTATVSDPLGTAIDATGGGTPPSDTEADPLGTGSVTGDVSDTGESGSPPEGGGGQLEHETAHQGSGDGATGRTPITGGEDLGDPGFGAWRPQRGRGRRPGLRRRARGRE